MKNTLVVGLFVVVIALAGCGNFKLNLGGVQIDSSTPAKVMNAAKDNASVLECRATREQIDGEYAAARSANTAPVDFAALVKQLNAKCPVGGTYSWDATAKRSRCSIHGE